MAPQQPAGQAQDGPSRSGGLQPPQAPHVPTGNIQALILRLTHTIHDIDAFQNLLASGAPSGTLPSWDNILQRYSVLLSRINALQSYLQRPPPAPPNLKPGETPPTDPALQSYVVHPLNPLPPQSLPPNPPTGNEPVNPIAYDIFELVMATMPNPDLSSSREGLLQSEDWRNKDDLRGLSEPELERISRELRGRIGREQRKAQAVRDEISKVEEEYDWEMRIDNNEEGEEDEEGGRQKQDNSEGNDDLFGDDDSDVVMVDKPDVASNKTIQISEKKVPQRGATAGWSLADHLAFIDAGKRPFTVPL